MKRKILFFFIMIFLSSNSFADEHLIVTVVKESNKIHIHDEPTSMSIDFDSINDLNKFLLIEEGSREEKNIREALKYLMKNDENLDSQILRKRLVIKNPSVGDE